MKILVFLLLISSHALLAQKTLQPKIGFTPDISGTAKQRYEMKKKKYEELTARIEKGEKYENFTQPEKKLMDEFDDPDGIDPWSVGSGGCSWYCGAAIDKISASSVLAPQGKNIYGADNAHDFTLNTAWVEGVKGPGIGEFIEYTFPKAHPPVTTAIIFNGYVKSDKAWAENARIKKLKMYINGKPYAFLELKDVKSEQSFALGSLQNLKGPLVLRFEIAEVYKGTKYEDTVLSELYFDGTGVHCFIPGTMITMADYSLKPIEDIEEGDEILSYNFEKQLAEPSIVRETVRAMHHNLHKYQFEGFSVIATDDHPFFSADKGWVSLNPEQSANYLPLVSTLSPGVSVMTLNKSGKPATSKLLWASKIDQCQLTYTITKLAVNNSFFANGILVSTEEVISRPSDLVLENHK